MSLEVLELNGSATERGQRHGNEFANAISANVDRYLELFGHYGVDAATAREMAEQFVPLITDEAPKYAAEMEGIAEGSGMPLVDVALLNARYEVLYGAYANTAAEQSEAPDGCTSFVLQGETTADSQPYLGQNWG